MTTRAIALATLLLFALLSLACRNQAPRIGYLVALDAATGEELWRVETGITLMAAPVVSGDTVSVVGGDCLSPSLATHTFSVASGEPISQAVNPSELGGCRRMPPELVTTSMQFSRVLGSGELVATDRNTGEERWRMDPMEVTSGEANHSFTAGSDILVFTYIRNHRPERPHLPSDPDHPEGSTKTTIVLDANSGAELWRVVEEEAISSRDDRAQISTDDQTVYIMYTGLVAHDDGRLFPEGRIEAFEAHTGVMLWEKTSAVFTINANVAFGNGRLLVANDNLAVMLDAVSGDTIWEKPIQPPSASTEGAIANGVAYLALSAAPYGGRRD